jgi:hypothetical protein
MTAVDILKRAAAGHSPGSVIDGVTFRQPQELPQTETWAEPEPLPESKLQPVEKITAEILPSALKPWLVDISHRMQCPLDFVAAGCMVALSSVIGAGCAIRPKRNDDWSVVPNLWGGVIGRPSMLKTPSLSEVLKPINRLEQAAKTKHEADQSFQQAEQEAFKAVKGAIISDMAATAKCKGKSGKSLDALKMELAGIEEPEEAIRRRFRTNDSTIEKLGELLNQNPRGLLIFRDELTGLLCSWDREDRQQDRAFYLEAWNGNQNFTADRIGRGTVETQNCCLSILGGIQPAKLLGYLLQASSSLQNDGMLQRFQLLVYPDEPAAWALIDEKPDLDAREAAYEVFDKLAEMDFTQQGTADNDRPYYHFNDQAQDIFYEWLKDLEAKIRAEENPLICEHLAKYRSLMASIALIIHLTDIAGGAAYGQVSESAIIKAAAWCEYLESHARRIYRMLAGTEEKAAAVLAERIKRGELQDGFTARDVYRKGWYLLNDRNKVEAACRELEELGWIRSKPLPVINRYAKQGYEINPKIFL